MAQGLTRTLGAQRLSAASDQALDEAWAALPESLQAAVDEAAQALLVDEPSEARPRRRRRKGPPEEGR